ncbi:hypothetical protein [Lewinella sp. IMCC34183]|uniref:hypothetical protein n=1 Tax=Lewinella sp. IMCC34183 TaxID=2248762 RepID=UPI000E21E59E|nr:hypothetical protein [Lewinella sp. IMCC34183]
MTNSLFILACLFCNISLLLAQSPLINPLPEPDPAWESWRNRVPVSGEIRVGLGIFSEGDKVGNSFFVGIPPLKSTSTICTEITSIDGRYSGAREYSVKGLTSGIYELAWPTKYLGDLRKYAPTEVVILSSVGKCKENAESYLISGWQKPVNQDTITVLLNCDKTTNIKIYDKGRDSTLVFQSVPIDGFSSVSFNSYVKIPWHPRYEHCEIFIEQRVRRGPRSVSFNRFPLLISTHDALP